MKRSPAALIWMTMFGVACSQPADTTSPSPTDAAPEALPASIDLDPYEPEIDPARFDNPVDNPYLPFSNGRTMTYEGETDEGLERIVVELMGDTKKVMGIDCIIVKDTVTIDGVVEELTYDWYAQDDDGNVWYMGEDSTDYADGEPDSKEGSWEAGVDGAFPGIVMPAEPAEGQHYRQEYFEGEAEDTGEVLKVGGSVAVEAGSYDEVIVTEDLNLLEPDVTENKFYAKGVGLVKEEERTEDGTFTIELVKIG